MAHSTASAIGAARAGRGRWLALLVLALASLALAFPDHSPLEQLRAAWFELYQATFPRERRAAPAVIVEVDERSLSHLGPWPWPRTRLAELIERIGDSGAAAIGLDMVLPEADSTSPEALIPRLDPNQREAIAALSALPSHDARLADTLRRHPVVLGIAGVDRDHAVAGTRFIQQSPPLVRGGEIESSMRRYAGVLASLPLLQHAASGQGTVNARLERGTLPRVPLVSTEGTHLLPALALELIRVATRAPAVTVEVRDGAVAALTLGDLRIPTEPDGMIRVHFSRVAPSRYLSALDLFQAEPGSVALRERLEGRIAIVAMTGLALSDRRIGPRGETVSGADVHAQMIESFAQRRFLLRPPWMPAAETAVLLALGGLLIAVTPAMRRQQALLLLASVLVLALALGFALFVWTGLLFDSAGLAAGLFVVFSSLVASALVQADQARRASERSLQAAREGAARVAGEIEAARRIQLGILPGGSSFPHERRFELAAAIEPAQSVGGDLYDFFMLDADRLFFHVADVSGKGIPASLFMAITKVLTKSIALRAGRDPGHLLTQANVELSRDNPESLFVTAFAAILDAASGELTYWTAGHDTPLVYDGSALHRLDRSQAGPPLCAVSAYEYRPQHWRLRPGSLLVLFTDGVPEAEDRSGALYGTERLARLLQALDPATSASAALAAIRADVDTFVAGAPASDDLTLMVLRWLGPDGPIHAP